MTNVFIYGTLLDAATLRRRSGDPSLARQRHSATLSGFWRVLLRGTRYPTLRRHRGACVSGLLLALPARAIARLAAYEGPRYRLARVVVLTAKGKTAAYTWIAPGGTRRPWRN